MQKRVKINELVKCFKAPFLEEVLDMTESFCVPAGMLIRAVRIAVKGTERIKEILRGKEAPNFMDCVIFKCKEGYVLSQIEQTALEQIILRKFVSSDAKSLNTIAVFIDECMGGDIEAGSEDEYSIEDSYVAFNFCTGIGDECEYDEEGIEYVMAAINALLGKDIFDMYVIGGHTESWNE